MPTYQHGNRTIESDALVRYADPMTEQELAEFLGVSEAHARRHRSANPPNSAGGWPTVSRRKVAPTKAHAGHHLAVCYKHSAVRSWMRKLEAVES